MSLFFNIYFNFIFLAQASDNTSVMDISDVGNFENIGKSEREVLKIFFKVRPWLGIRIIQFQNLKRF